MPLGCHLFCNFFISPFLSCTQVTSKGPKAKRLLVECGGTVPSRTLRSEVPRTRFSRLGCVVLPYPMEHRVQTLEGRSVALTSIIAVNRAGGAIRVFGIPPSCVCSYVKCYNSASLYFRQDIRSDPCFVFFVYVWPCWSCIIFCWRCCFDGSRIRVSGSFVLLSFHEMLHRVVKLLL